MRELQLQRAINVVAAASVLVVATGCGDRERRVASRWCKTQKICNEDDFDAQWASKADCVEDRLDEIDEIESESCRDAFVDFSACWARAYRADCNFSDAYDACFEEDQAFYDECPY